MPDTTKPTIEKAHGCDPVGFQNDTTNVSIIAPSEKIGNSDKAFATLQARAALAGVVLHRASDDHGRAVYIVSRWSLTRQLDSLADAADWLDRVTGKPVEVATA